MRKRYAPEKKVEILREHLKNNVPVSEVCKKYGINPNLFYKWEKQFFEGGISLFAQTHKNSPKVSAKEDQLKSKITNLNEVISELTQENISLKKKCNGEV